MQQAIELKERKPDLGIYIFYRDIRTYGFREDLYKKARELGVLFIRYSLDGKPVVEQASDGKLINHRGRPYPQAARAPRCGLPAVLATAIIPKGQKDWQSSLRSL